MAIVTLRYWAAAKEAAGVAEDKVEADSLAQALAAAIAGAAERPGDSAQRLRQVMRRSSFLVDGQPAGTRPPSEIALRADAVIEVLPPFAGG